MTSRALGLVAVLIVTLTAASVAAAQSVPVERLPRAALDVMPPSARVTGAPGGMTIAETSCPMRPAENLRRRIVDVAAQEWAYFGFTVVDQTRPGSAPARPRGPRRGFRWLDPVESARVAASIAGYWTVTPQGSWILGNQNDAWQGPDGVATRWRDPWSAAFVSWVMCEAGLSSPNQFTRAVAHHVYIDQAIRARTSGAGQAAYVAYDIGERPIEPGDLLCSGRRPAYRSIADRQRQMGDGARTHCDVVVKLDPAGRVLTIGGNVRGVVSLKVMPSVQSAARASDSDETPLGEVRGMFAHLKLRAAPIAADALDSSPTIGALGCLVGFRPPPQLAVATLAPAEARTSRC